MSSHEFGFSCDGASDLTAKHARSFYIENENLHKDEPLEPTTSVCLQLEHKEGNYEEVDKRSA